MKTAKISLNSIDKVKAFVNEISKFDCDFDLVSGRYVIDAKSIMGIFSLDLSKPIDLNIHADGAALDLSLIHIYKYGSMLPDTEKDLYIPAQKVPPSERSFLTEKAYDPFQIPVSEG